MPPNEPQQPWGGTPATVRQIWEQHGAKQMRRQQSATATQRHRAQRQTTMSRRAHDPAHGALQSLAV